MLEVGVEPALSPNKDGAKSASCTQKSTHAVRPPPDQCLYRASCLRDAVADRDGKDNYEALIFYPHDTGGKCVELDAEAFEVIESWEALPDALKTAIVSIVRSNAKGGA